MHWPISGPDASCYPQRHWLIYPSVVLLAIHAPTGELDWCYLGMIEDLLIRAQGCCNRERSGDRGSVRKAHRDKH
ncbi:hypothetical protein TNCV_5051651 [Trichonephila clavipes]|nr:hypothetical protein TNCV_5051651 [Trichonephila clavipes]